MMDIQSLNTEDVDKLLHQKRKYRGSQACYPCRRRKVKCDNQVPCEVCKKRNHAELCTYEPSSKVMRTATGDDHHLNYGSEADESGSNTTTKSPTRIRARSIPGTMNCPPPPRRATSTPQDVPRADPELAARLSSMEATLATIQNQLSHLTKKEMVPNTPGSCAESSSSKTEARRKIEGVHTTDHAMGAGVYLGGSSMPAFVMEHSREKGSDEQQVQDGFLPIFGLQDATADFPFYNVWTPDNILRDVYAALPADARMLRLFTIYREHLHRVLPFLTDPDEFEQQLRSFIEERALTGFRVAGQDWANPAMVERVSWLALLYSVLASGTQLSDDPVPQRDSLCQRYASYSFQCLRMVNFFVRPSFNNIQTLLILGNILQNQQNPGVAWILLGTTIRLCQTIGMHRELPQGSVTGLVDHKRRRLWALVVRTDAFLSVMYDRPPAVGTLEASYPFPQPSTPSYSYNESWYRLCVIGVQIIQKSIFQLPPIELIEQLRLHHAQLERCSAAGQPHLREITRCRNTQERLEHITLRMHKCFFSGWLYRPALGMPADLKAEVGAEDIADECVKSLIDTLRFFMQFHEMSALSTRVWLILHSVLSCALLLGIIGEIQKNPEVHTLVGDLIAILERADGIAAETDSGEKPRPLSRVLTALRNLHVHGALVEPPTASQAQVQAQAHIPRPPTPVATSRPLDPAVTQAPVMPAVETDAMAQWGDQQMYSNFLGSWDSSEFVAPNDVLNSILYGQPTLDDSILPGGQDYLWSTGTGW